MNESVYRRLCMTSVCGAILIPVTMALVSRVAAGPDDRLASSDATAVVALAPAAAPATRPSTASARATTFPRSASTPAPAPTNK